MTVMITVVPRSSREGVFVEGETVKVRVHAAPVDGEANENVWRLLSDVLGVAKSMITIVRGEKSRQKMIEISGITEEEFWKRLASFKK